MAVTKIDGTRQITASSITNASQNFGTPSATTDVAIKSYVDGVAQGLSVKPSAAAATAAVLSPTNTYASGVLTATGNGTLTVDGYATVLNDYLLIKNETGLKNGLYKVTTAGTASVPYVLTRAVEMDVSAEFTGAFVFIEQGTVNASSGWVCTNIAPTVGTTGITFTQFSGAGELSSGNGITITANSVAINTAVTVDLNTIQTLTNKTLTSPAINTPTGIVKGDVGLGNVPNLSFSGSNTGDQTITLTGGVTGSGTGSFAATVVTNANLTGDVTSTGNGTTLAVFHRSTTVTGTQDGANKVFTLGNTPKTISEQIFLNGQLLMPGASNDYVLSAGTTITFQSGFTAPASTDVIRAYATY